MISSCLDTTMIKSDLLQVKIWDFILPAAKFDNKSFSTFHWQVGMGTTGTTLEKKSLSSLNFPLFTYFIIVDRVCAISAEEFDSDSSKCHYACRPNSDIGNCSSGEFTSI